MYSKFFDVYWWYQSLEFFGGENKCLEYKFQVKLMVKGVVFYQGDKNLMLEGEVVEEVE